jgi:hypothetical protein
MTRYNKRDGGFNFQYPGLTMSLMFDHTEPMLRFYCREARILTG